MSSKSFILSQGIFIVEVNFPPFNYKFDNQQTLNRESTTAMTRSSP